MLFVKAALQECEGLAATLGSAENSLASYDERHNGKKQKRSACRMSPEEMAAIADQFNLDYDTLVDTLSLEFSSWSHVADHYADRASALRASFLAGLPLGSAEQSTVAAAYVTGMISHHGGSAPECRTESDRELVERCVRTFIGYFRLVIDQANAGTLFTPEHVLIEKK
jgi:hypothetical protein